MRPVNLIPPEERRGERAALRTGVLPYLIVAVLALVLAGVTAVVLTGNQISDRKAEMSALEVREAQAQARAQALRPYAEFAGIQQAREATVTSLAKSRFDWERVLRELAIVMPDDIWLVKLTGAVRPDVELEQGAATSIGQDVTGPALRMVGCGASHESVARLIEALRDIDGVTRVGLGKSTRPEGDAAASSTGDAEDDCRTRDFITQFEVVAAFDEVPVEPVVAPAPAMPMSPTDEDEAVADARQQELAASDSVAEQTAEARDATNLVPGTIP